MAKEDIPIKQSAFGGTPVTDVLSAQRAIKESSILGAQNEPSQEDEEKTETTEEVSAQDMESESVETEAANPDGLTAEDIKEENTEEEVEEQERYTVKAAGKEHSVTLDELKKGFQFGADYSRKNAMLGEDRQKLEEEKRMLSQQLETTQQERQRYLSRLEDIDQIVDNDLKAFESTDWAKLKVEDPVQYSIKRDEERQLQESRKQIAEERKSQQYAAQLEAEKKIEEVRVEQARIVADKIPNWSDPVEGPKVKSRIKNFAIKSGFTENDISQLIDARSVEILHKAMKYDDLVNAKIKNKKVNNVPKVTRPGTKQTSDEVNTEKRAQQKARLRRTGSVKDAQDLIKNLL
jgi:hypothetical protein